MKEYVIDSRYSKASVKQLLRREGFSSALVTRLKKDEQGILLNGERVTVRAILTEGDRLVISDDDRCDDENEYTLPVNIPISIIYEDDDIVIVNKAPGMPTHPSHRHRDDTLANALAYYYSHDGRPFVFRAVNRLDAGTSGVVLVAKTKFASARLAGQMQSGLIRKTYTAMLVGDAGDSGTIDKAIRRRMPSIIEREVCREGDPGAQSAVTRWRAIRRCGALTLVNAMPMTGRTHQLRVHFASIGHPILGDSLYGESDGRMRYQALCATRLEFFHPTTGCPMSVSARLCNEMKTTEEETNWES